MVYRIQTIISTVLLVASISVPGFAASQQEQANIRELNLGRVVQLVESDDESFSVALDVYVLCKGTKLEFDRTAALLRSKPMLIQAISGRIASQRGSWIWKVAHINTVQAHFNRELQRRIGDKSIIGLGFQGYRITRTKNSEASGNLPSYRHNRDVTSPSST